MACTVRSLYLHSKKRWHIWRCKTRQMYLLLLIFFCPYSFPPRLIFFRSLFLFFCRFFPKNRTTIAEILDSLLLLLRAPLLEVFTLNLGVRDIECSEWILGCRFCLTNYDGIIEKRNLCHKLTITRTTRRLRYDDVTVKLIGILGIRHFFELRANPVEPLLHLLRDLYSVCFDINSHTINVVRLLSIHSDDDYTEVIFRVRAPSTNTSSLLPNRRHISACNDRRRICAHHRAL